MGFARHARVVFVLGGGDPGRAEQRQAGKEVEECHQAQHRPERRTGRGFHQRRQGIRHHDFDHFKPDSGDKRAANQRFLAWTMAWQTPENPEEQQIVGEY
ncbi:hypothetical protein D3C76_1375820 [compost metagenome]